MEETARRLIIMRHAKAVQDAATDHARTLSDRGRRDAAAAGEYLARAGFLPDHALVSDAVRTRETWDEVVRGSRHPVDAWFDRALYDGDADAIVELVRAAPDAARAVIVVGHNPAVESVVHLLHDGRGDAIALDGLASGYPTSALTVLEVDGAWGGLGPGSCPVLAYHVARG